MAGITTRAMRRMAWHWRGLGCFRPLIS